MARTTAPGPTVGAEVDPTQPGKIPELVAELDRLRARVAEMEIEREEVRKKRSRSLSGAFPGFGWGALCRCKIGCSARSTCWPAPGCAHRDFDQSWKHSGSVKSIQPVGVTQGVIRHTLRTRAKYCLRGVRVGEAKNPGPHRRRRRRVPSEGSESGLPRVVHHDLTLIDSSDDDVPLVVPRSGRESVPRMDRWNCA